MITMRHLQNSAKIMLATGLIVAYGYFFETFIAFYSGSTYERFMVAEPLVRALCSFLLAADPDEHRACRRSCGSPRFRANTKMLFRISLVILVGMWLERFVIIITSLSRDFLPSSWGHYTPTRWDYAVLAGTIGFFSAAMYIFIRIMPTISIFEMRQLLPESEVKAK